MAVSRETKENVVASYGGGLAQAQHAFVVGFSGIDVNSINELRRQIQAGGGHYSVVKNRLALRAVEGSPLAELQEHFTGPTAVAYSSDDPVGLAKTLTKFADDVPGLEFKAGVVDGQPVAGDEVVAISKLPSREDLLTKLVFILQSPVQRLVGGLGAIPRQFVVALEQVRLKREESE